MPAANLFVHNVSRFRSFRKIIFGVIRKWSSEAALNFEFYLSDWHFRPTLFTAVLISYVWSSDGDLTPPILPGGKKSRSTLAFKLTSLTHLVYHAIFSLKNESRSINIVFFGNMHRNWHTHICSYQIEFILQK